MPNANHKPGRGLEKVGSAAVDALAMGIRRHGPDAIGVLLVGVASVLVAVLAATALGTPGLLAGIGFGGMTSGVLALHYRRRHD